MVVAEGATDCLFSLACKALINDDKLLLPAFILGVSLVGLGE